MQDQDAGCVPALPVGQIIFVNPKKVAFVQPVAEKYIASVFRKSMFMIHRPASMKRGERFVTIVRRDAMDANRLARRATPGAYGKGVWSWHPWAGVKSRETFRGATVTNKVMDTGESAQISRRTIAQGMPMLWLYL